MSLKRRINTPPHLLLDNTLYFITGAIYLKRPLLAKAEVKQQLLAFIQGYFHEYDWELHHWVILDNHYHLLGKSERGADLPRILRKIHIANRRAIFNNTRRLINLFGGIIGIIARVMSVIISFV